MRDTFSHIVYSLSTDYNPSEDARRLTLHILCVMRIEVLRDYCIRMTETGGDVNGLRPCFDEPRCMGMTKAVWFKLTQTRCDALMLVWYPISTSSTAWTISQMCARLWDCKREKHLPCDEGAFSIRF